MTHQIITVGTRTPKAPNLPIAPNAFDQRYLDSLTNTLRLYFVELDNVLGLLVEMSAAQTSVKTYTSSTVLLGLLDGMTLIDTSLNDVQVLLPDATTSVGYLYTIKRITAGANTLTISALSGNIDDGASAMVNTQYLSLSFRSDGKDYWII